jgi:hypothetical protein
MNKILYLVSLIFYLYPYCFNPINVIQNLRRIHIYEQNENSKLVLKLILETLNQQLNLNITKSELEEFIEELFSNPRIKELTSAIIQQQLSGKIEEKTIEETLTTVLIQGNLLAPQLFPKGLTERQKEKLKLYILYLIEKNQNQ